MSNHIVDATPNSFCTLLQKLLPSLLIIIIVTEVFHMVKIVSSTWPKHFLSEIDGQYDSSFVHFTGSLDYLPFLTILKSSDCHIYLTYPFVLSWSLLEAMSMNLPVVASSTSPVQEVIQDRVNGLLVDFFSPNDLATSVAEVIQNKQLSVQISDAARDTIFEKLFFRSRIPQQLNLINWCHQELFLI